MKIRYHGHSCVEIKNNDTSIIIDPFITGNAYAKISPENLTIDYIYVTHGHGDHLGDTLDIAKNNNATVIAPFELATYLSWRGIKTHPLHIGGGFDFGNIKVKAIKAEHGSSIIDDNNKEIIYTGMPSGVLIELDNQRIYHAGDTGLFGDMKLLKNENLDLAFLPIGGNFTMGPEDALIAAEWIGANNIVPIHYNTFPVIKQDPNKYVDELKYKGIKGQVLPINHWIEI